MSADRSSRDAAGRAPEVGADHAVADEVTEAVAAIGAENARARAELLDAIEGLPDERRRECRFGDWSLYEVMAHLAAWHDGFAAALECAVRGERPRVPGYDSDLPDATDRFNASVAAGVGGVTWDELLARLDAAHARHDAALRSIPGRIAPDRFEDGRSARRLAAASRHYREHIPEIVEWRRREGL